MIHITGIVIAISTFLIIGLFHPLVIKTEYYLGTRPWWLFLFGGILCVVLSLLQADIVWSSLLGVLGGKPAVVDRRTLRPGKARAEGLVPHEPEKKGTLREEKTSRK